MNFVNSSLMSSTFKLCSQPNLHNVQCQALADDTLPHGQNVGIIVFSHERRRCHDKEQHEYLAPYWQQCQCQFQYRKSKCLCQILPLPLLLPLVPQYRDNRRTAYHRYRNPDTHNRYPSKILSQPALVQTHRGHSLLQSSFLSSPPLL